MMELDFDKEIDALLRKARRDSPAGQGAPASRHLDADELSAFAENAVPESSRAFYFSHLADCDSCRRTLVELNALNADAAPAAASESATAAGAAEIPWWKRLFAMPNLAYAMGVLVLLFSGMTGYLVFQRGPASGESQLARVTDNRETYSTISNANAAAPMVSNAANTSTNSVA
ncbi:MAG TPA: zf-HC2 domain-containing protein, partial [Pyrinomonadaceae bacterium]|nr:zf-HC2 domain-containing protein [Pyrinomonadaceae bacterium]